MSIYVRYLLLILFTLLLAPPIWYYGTSYSSWCLTAGEVKNLSSPHDLRSGCDVYVVAALDQEEIFRTATVERSIK